MSLQQCRSHSDSQAEPRDSEQKVQPWPTVLYVDDDPNIVSAMERNFHRYKVSLVCAYHGMQGIWLAATQRPNLIVTDMAMPLATGDELIDCLSTHPATRSTPILVLTGDRSKHMTAHLQRCGVVSVLHKPLNANELFEVVSKYIPLIDRNAA